MKKKILYMIFLPFPSAIVRATVFKAFLERDGFEITYYYNYSVTLIKVQDLVKRFGLIAGIFDFPFRALQKIIGMIKIRVRRVGIEKFDAVVLIKNIRAAWLPPLKEKIKGKILYDFDDAVWLPYMLGRNEFESVTAAVDFVSTDNDYLKSVAEVHNKNTFVVNGPCQVELFDAYTPPQRSDNEPVVIGWIGSPATVFYLYAIYDALEEIGSRYSNVILRLVGAGYDKSIIPKFEKLKLEIIPNYDQAEMVRQVRNFDIGLYSLFRNSLSLGRGTLKATIYMAGRVPAVCSAFGDNLKIITDGENGFLANSTEQWVSKIEKLIKDGELRKSMGSRGHAWVTKNLSIESCYNQLRLNFLNKIN
jgi:glycosyltransferase involved in cell wall biosynthesis